jgi:hypothetical protein
MPEHKDAFKTYKYTILIKQKIKEKKEDSVEAGTDYEHQGANNYSMQQHRDSNNSSTKMTASKLSYKDLHLQNPLTAPCGRQSRK